MKRDNFRRMAFVTSVCLLSLPWLTPCVLGGLSAMAVRGTGRVLFGKPDSVLQFSNQAAQNQKTHVILDQPLKVHEHGQISRALLITPDDLERIDDMKSPRHGLSFRERSAGKFESVADSLNGTEEWWDKPVQSGRPERSDVLTRPVPADKRISVRYKVVLCSDPFVLFEADDLRYVQRGKEKHPVMALAATNTGLQANATIITPGGNYFATARRIHFRGPSPEIVLEGNPVVQFGRRQVKPARPGTLMKFNFITHEVTVGGRAVESKF